MKRALLALAMASSVFAEEDIFKQIAAMKNEQWCKDQVQWFGTVSDPRYKIVKDVVRPSVFIKKEKEYERFSQEMRSARVEAEKALNLLSDLADTGNPIKDTARTLAEHSSSKLRGIEGVVQAQHTRQLSSMIAAAYRTRVECAIDPLLISKSLFTILTERPFPDKIKEVSMEFSVGEISAVYVTSLRCIAWKGRKNYAEVSNLLHEFGHVIAQHGEVAGNPKRGTRSLEEACAFAFNYAGICELFNVNPIIALTVHKQFITQLLAQDDLEHGEGAALFFAAREVFKEPRVIFNTLASVPDSSLDALNEILKQASGYEGENAIQYFGGMPKRGILEPNFMRLYTYSTALWSLVVGKPSVLSAELSIVGDKAVFYIDTMDDKPNIQVYIQKKQSDEFMSIKRPEGLTVRYTDHRGVELSGPGAARVIANVSFPLSAIDPKGEYRIKAVDTDKNVALGDVVKNYP